MNVARLFARVAGVCVILLADWLNPPEPVRGWSPALFDYEEQD